MDRRTFLSFLPLPFTPAVFPSRPSVAFLTQEQSDAELCSALFTRSLDKKLHFEPIGDVVVEAGRSFLGTPYVANALEVPGEERLVVNMRGLDCVSFYENALVIARCLRAERTTFDDYKRELQFIRYRGGVIDGYASRLHYTSDYFFDNDRKKVWRDITREAGGVRFEKTIDFMSTNPDAYRQIREDAEVLEKIRNMERELNARERYYIPTAAIAGSLKHLRNGDILGFTTSIPGLDTSHTGILIKERGVDRVMHAPLAGKKVVVSESSLAAYVAGNTKMTGIIVARPLEPKKG